MEIKFSRHAELEMARRKIPRTFVESALENPQQIVSETTGRKTYQSILDFDGGKKYLLRIIVDDSVVPAVVVTAYKTSKIDKYWRKI